MTRPLEVCEEGGTKAVVASQCPGGEPQTLWPGEHTFVPNCRQERLSGACGCHAGLFLWYITHTYMQYIQELDPTVPVTVMFQT